MSGDALTEDVVVDVKAGETKSGSPMLKVTLEGGEQVTFFKAPDVGKQVAPGDVVQFKRVVKGQYLNGEQLAVVRKAGGARPNGTSVLEAKLQSPREGAILPESDLLPETEMHLPGSLKTEALLVEIRDLLRAIGRHLGVK